MNNALFFIYIILDYGTKVAFRDANSRVDSSCTLNIIGLTNSIFNII